ncbi:hypothetical protein D5R81_04610 [Parashewanella spongiae]|uniref:Uncharacterized protein n=1 Tax=Parashewanella spongiae TaxID=342950 RepID=A0A3A6U3F0_9GAMM|nr:hypothetical protein [Parashewanella spongiae]MCL1077316.1 hypothetical protein [Parashewanella spongiae]RJY18597.1 hypothetical protein D5R81_04610 [Parashewanella spongiae]
MKKLLFVIAGFGLIVGGYFFGKHSSLEALNNIGRAEAKLKNETIAELKRLTQELKQQNFLLTKNLELATKKLQSNVDKHADELGSSGSSEQAAVTNSDEPLITKESPTIADVMRKAMTSGVSIHQKLTDDFELQETDFEWAPEQENNLRDIIAANEKLQSYGVTQVSCKQQWCKIEFLAEQALSTMDVSSNFIFAMKDQDWYSDNIVFYESSDDGEASHLFISRDENTKTLMEMITPRH